MNHKSWFWQVMHVAHLLLTSNDTDTVQNAPILATPVDSNSLASDLFLIDLCIPSDHDWNAVWETMNEQNYTFERIILTFDYIVQ